MPCYFAFGSNMDVAQMARRCPGAQAMGRATLTDHRLVFRGRWTPSPRRSYRNRTALDLDWPEEETAVNWLVAFEGMFEVV